MAAWSPHGPSFPQELLLHGQALTMQLNTHLDGSPRLDLCRSMVQDLLSTWDQLMRIAAQDQQSQPHCIKPESPQSAPETPRVRSPQQPSPKKRKALPSWTGRVQVSTAAGLDAEDGYNWRKYGQKRILGARNPRGYFRCTHRFTRHCEALKMVQRSDEDPSVLVVTYRGKHTCGASPRPAGGAGDRRIRSPKLEVTVETELPPAGTLGTVPPPVSPDSGGFQDSGGDVNWYPEEFEDILTVANSVGDSPTIGDGEALFTFEELAGF